LTRRRALSRGFRFASTRSLAASLGLLAVAGLTAAGQPASAATAAHAATAATAGHTAPVFGRAVRIKLPAGASKEPGAGLYAVSCTRKGYCSGGGSYTSATKGQVAFVVTQSHGSWGRAASVRLPAGADPEPDAQVNGISCTSPGYCVAVGGYSNSKGSDGFIVTQSRGKWGRAVPAKVPSGAKAGESDLLAISCPRWNGCEAVGEYLSKHSDLEAVAEAQRPGRWNAAEIAMPVKSAPDPAPYLQGLSCSSVGNCAAVGSFDNNSSSPDAEAALGALLSHGKWRRAVQLRVPSSKPGDDSGISSISCNALGHCLGTGAYFLPGDDAPFYGVSIHGGRRSLGRGGEHHRNAGAGCLLELRRHQLHLGDAVPDGGWLFQARRQWRVRCRSRHLVVG